MRNAFRFWHLNLPSRRLVWFLGTPNPTTFDVNQSAIVGLFNKEAVKSGVRRGLSNVRAGTSRVFTISLEKAKGRRPFQLAISVLSLLRDYLPLSGSVPGRFIARIIAISR